MLQKYGVPNVVIELVWSLHDGISATVMVGGGKSETSQFSPECTITPTLSILYFGLVRWYQSADVKVKFTLGGNLISSFVLSESLFADDTALVYSCREDIVLAEVAGELGLTNDDLVP